MRIQIELRSEVCELELSGASRRVLMSNRGGAGAIKSGLIDSGGETTVIRISAFCHDFLERDERLRIGVRLAVSLLLHFKLLEIVKRRLIQLKIYVKLERDLFDFSLFSLNYLKPRKN